VRARTTIEGVGVLAEPWPGRGACLGANWQNRFRSTSRRSASRFGPIVRCPPIGRRCSAQHGVAAPLSTRLSDCMFIGAAAQAIECELRVSVRSRDTAHARLDMLGQEIQNRVKLRALGVAPPGSGKQTASLAFHALSAGREPGAQVGGTRRPSARAVRSTGHSSRSVDATTPAGFPRPNRLNGSGRRASASERARWPRGELAGGHATASLFA
jgi:hypothetical protein